MIKIRSIVLAVVAIASFAIPSFASASTSHVSTKTYALGHAKKCKTGFTKKTETHKVNVKLDGKIKKVSRRYVACVYKTPAKATLTVSKTATVVSSTSKGNSRATIDPTYTQSVSNPLDVTFAYSAGETQGTLPSGVLNLFWGASTQSQTLACSLNVGDKVLGGKCEVVFPSYGPESITVQYTSGSSSASETDSVDIENPNPAPPTLTAPGPLATTTSLSLNGGDSVNGYIFNFGVSDANGSVSSGTVTMTATLSVSGSNVHPTWQITSSVGQGTCTVLMTGPGNWDVHSTNCAVTASNTSIGGGTASLTLQASFAVTNSDLASTSGTINYP